MAVDGTQDASSLVTGLVHQVNRGDLDGRTPPTFDVDDPSTGELLDRVEEMATEVPTLVVRARAAQTGWDELGFAGRADVLRSCRKWLVAHRYELAALSMRETGNLYEEALFTEVFLTADSLRYWARRAGDLLAPERIPVRSPYAVGRKVAVEYKPIGVVGIIAPWNYPVGIGIGDAIPALMAGNAVILKPSELTPLTTRRVVAGFHDAGLPEDVLICATGDGRTGAALVDNADMIAFTGSTATGRKVAARAGERLIPCSLELGGKDPMIVCADADLDRAVNGAIQWGLTRAGQVCMSIERIYVEQPVYEPFVAKLAERVQSLRQAMPGDAGSTDVGAMTMPRQLDIVSDHVADAREKGARILTGGAVRPGPGRFFEPTVLADVDHTMKCMREETFGPTLPVMPVVDTEEAIQRANDSTYGLSASVWTKDLTKGAALARRIRSGSVGVNDANVMFAVRDAPFGGTRDSGSGTRNGADGIRRYCQPQTMLITRFGPKRDLGWLPTNPRVTRVMDRLLSRYYSR